MRPRSSVLAELGWLLYFFVVFALAANVMLVYVVPHHFNRMIAVMLAAIFAGLVMIGTRALRAARAKR